MRGKLTKRIRREVEVDYFWMGKDNYYRLETGQIINAGLTGLIRRVKDRLKKARRYG